MNYLNVTSWGLTGALSGSFIYIITKDLIKRKEDRVIMDYDPNIINPGFAVGLLLGSLHGYLEIPLICYVLSSK
jgi:hypothetical protein